jgi:hypothetical protein
MKTMQRRRSPPRGYDDLLILRSRVHKEGRRPVREGSRE